MKIATKSFISLALHLSLTLISFTAYSAAEELNVPAELHDVFPVITRGALFIAERVKLNLIDCNTLSDLCNKPHLLPKDAFIESAVNALYANTTDNKYPIVQALLLEIGHIPATTPLEGTVNDQLNKLLMHIDYMLYIIPLLPDNYNEHTAGSYAALNIILDPTTPYKKTFAIDYTTINNPIDAQQVRFACKAFFSKKYALKELTNIKNDITAYLASPEKFIEDKKSKEEELAACAKLSFF